VAFWLSFISIFTLIFDHGFDNTVSIQQVIHFIYLLTLAGGIAFLILSYTERSRIPRKKIWLVDAVLILLFVGVAGHIINRFSDGFPLRNIGLNIAIISNFIRQLSTFRTEINRRYLNPAQLFILSFALIIVSGTLLLILPNSTHEGISLVDALFTSTSAVCVTGLTSVDTGTVFTPLGLTIILLLIQAGGIGIMTFTSYFGFFFKGGASYQNRLMIRDMTNEERISDVFSTLKKIILITFLIEFTGAVIIFASLDPNVLPGLWNRTFFALFHSVSAFCNAGFSTLSNNLYDPGFRFNYLLQLTIATLIIFGGIGFPIIFNTLKYLRYSIINRIIHAKKNHYPWVLGMTARIVLVTTFCLLLAGTVIIFFLESDNTLKEHHGIGKWITAFFAATTPRTAGFNTVDMSALHISTILITFILMWVGASPGSTGGGIKTTTFAIAILNFMSLARGKDRIEIFRREISPISVRRAFASISLSFIVLGLSVFFMALFESDMDLMKLAFESVSAFGTVGLSLGVTSSLSSAGKIVIILTMFIGRVSMLTILVAFMRRIVNLKYKFPTEDVLIN